MSGRLEVKPGLRLKLSVLQGVCLSSLLAQRVVGDRSIRTPASRDNTQHRSSFASRRNTPKYGFQLKSR